MPNVRKIQHVRPKVAQQPECLTCKNVKLFAIVLQYHRKYMMVLQLNGINKYNFLIHFLSYFLIPQNFSPHSLIISLLFSLFLLSFSYALSSLQTQNPIYSLDDPLSLSLSISLSSGGCCGFSISLSLVFFFFFFFSFGGGGFVTNVGVGQVVQWLQGQRIVAVWACDKILIVQWKKGRKELGIGTRNKKEIRNREVKQCNSYLNVLYNPYPFPISTTPRNQLTTYLTPQPNQLTAHNSTTIAVQLSCTSHCTHPRTHMQAHIHTLAGIHAPPCAHTHAHPPAHPYTITTVTLTYKYPQQHTIHHYHNIIPISPMAWPPSMKQKLGPPMNNEPLSLSLISSGLLGFDYGFWSLVCW